MAALVLSGGGISAVAAIGVLEALNELQIPIDLIAGSSAGALIGALYAAGMDLSRLRALALSASRHLFRISWGHLAWSLVRHRQMPLNLAEPEPLWQLTDPWLKGRSFQTTRMPLWITATDLVARQVCVLGPEAPPFDLILAKTLGVSRVLEPVDLATAVRASTAVPGLFPPVPLGPRILVDGGIGDDYPVDVAVMAGATRVMGVWIDEPTPWPVSPRLSGLTLGYQSLAVMIRQLTEVRQRAVRPPVSPVTLRIPMEAGMMAFPAIARLIDAGYAKAMAERAALAALVA